MGKRASHSAGCRITPEAVALYECIVSRGGRNPALDCGRFEFQRSVCRMPDSNKRSREAAFSAIDANADELILLSKFIHANPETGLQEFKCSAACVDFLQSHGFDVERNVSGLATAFAARTGTSGPSVAFLAEYDALAGIGHGCGHNLLAIANLAAGVGLKAAIDQGRSGRVIVFGTPAEESFGGKAIMAKAGAFE